MKLRKKLLVLCLTLCLVIAGAVGIGGSKRAYASIKEVDVAKDFISGGIQNIMDWKKVGDTTDTSYVSNIKGDVFAARGIGDAQGAFVPYKTTAFNEISALKMEFDLFEFETTEYFGILVDTNYFAHTDVRMNTGAIYLDGSTAFDAYRSSDFNEENRYAAQTAAYFFNLFTCAENGNHIEVTVLPDGTCGIKTTPLNADGTVNEAAEAAVAPFDAATDFTNKKNEIWLKNAYASKMADKTAQYYSGFLYGAANIVFDNYTTYTLAADSQEVKETLTEKLTFTLDDGGKLEGGLSLITTTVNFNAFTDGGTEGKILNHNGSGKGSIEEMVEVIAKPANGDRIVTDLKIAKDPATGIVDAFDMNAQLKFTKLDKKFGLAFGLEAKDSAIDGGGSSYVYFKQVQDDGADTYKTNVVVRNGSTESDPVSLGKNLIDGKFHDFNIVCAKTGAAKLKVDGGDAIDLQINNVEGYVALVTEGDGEAQVSIGSKTNIKGYEFKGSNAEGVQNNFNTGYVNPKNWTMNSKPAVTLKNDEDKKGVTLEDGWFRFNGAGDGSYIATVGQYADFVLEFKLREYADKPEQTRVNFLNSALAVNIGCTASTHGWADSNMFSFTTSITETEIPDGGLSELFTGGSKVYLYDFKSEMGKSSTTIGTISDYEFMPKTTGTTKVTAIKMVVYNNVINIWYQEVKDGETLKADGYKKIETDYKVKDTFGRIAFAVTDDAYMDIDDVRIVPIDDPDAEKMAANLAAFKDFEPIADEYRPVTLTAPELSVEGKTVSWEAVENATGYEISVNGTKTQLGADVTSYEITDDGEYTVTIVAKGDGVRYADSDESDPLEFTISGTGTNTNKDPDKKGCGCKSELGAGVYTLGGALALITVAGVALLLKKKKQD